MVSFLSQESLGAILLIVAGVIAYTVIYRLYLHPLAKIPGPKLAALTYFYEIYFNIVKPGMFVWEIKRLHEIYGRPYSRSERG